LRLKKQNLKRKKSKVGNSFPEAFVVTRDKIMVRERQEIAKLMK
jgi:hypothetical protein